MDQWVKPRQVVFGVLKTTWGIGHQESITLLADDYTASKYSGERKTALSREVVNAEIGRYHLCSFKPFDQSAAALVSAIHVAKRGCRSNPEIVHFLATKACEMLCESLENNGLSGTLCKNAMADIVRDAYLSDTNKAHLAMLLFCSVGCTADVHGSVDKVLAANKVMGARFRTVQSSSRGELAASAESGGQRFALLRIDAGGQGGQHVLNDEGNGTEIGRHSTAANAVIDVDMSVSKRHARIWRDDGGRWWIEGLGSTNGTELIDGLTRATIVVEPPASERSAGVVYPPVEVHLGDIIVLAGTTQFWVQGL